MAQIRPESSYLLHSGEKFKSGGLGRESRSLMIYYMAGDG
jgi:hypothetical protein